MKKRLIAIPAWAGKTRSRLALAALAALISISAAAQRPVLIHSCEDCRQTVPFYQAYAQKVYSIGADVFLHEGRLLVGHEGEDSGTGSSFEELYVNPIVRLFRQHGGRAWKDSDEHLQLLIGLASGKELTAVTELLGRYPDVFDASVHPDAVRIVLTGKIPEPSAFSEYPEWLRFDGCADRDYTPAQLERIALLSADFREFSDWNGKGSLLHEEAERLRQVIEKAHGWNKPIRFRNTPEGITVYYTFWNMGIDYVSTRCLEKCADFFRDFGNKNFRIGAGRLTAEKRVTGTKKLDKATRDFAGFQSDELQLSKGIGIYRPTHLNDGKDKKVKNVILLIGDGMGLSQIQAGMCANKGLSLLQLSYIGFQQNYASDAFTTDSAAGGSALATGERHDNRHISCTPEGKPVPSLTDHFKARGYAAGVVTLGDLTDATPTAFYGHAVERDWSDVLTAQLLDSEIDLVCGSGSRKFTEREDGRDMERELSEKYAFVHAVKDINARKGRVICVDDEMEAAAREDNLSLLADATREAIEKLRERGGKGFFLMVEGTKIDYAGHANCLPGSVLELLSFDLAVAEALKFADRNGETLVVVTADHETGGLTLLDGDEETGRVTGIYTTDDHSPALIPVFAYGPGAQRFHGTYMNIEIPRRIKRLVRR